MFKSLMRCIRRLFGRIKPKGKEQLERKTENGADIDIEDALAEELETQRRIFATQLANEHRDPSDTSIQAAVKEMQSLTPGLIGHTGEKPETVVSTTSSASTRVSSFSSSRASMKIPESVPEAGEPEAESVADKEPSSSPPPTQRASEMNPRRSSIFDMRSEWI
ncbi:hypothetical protein BBJ29_005841 [Phytophthora kernoviae]|uniref:Uncharacterized protein n=1 Tax=Phytophthora kernoviae TaxID=325452 RepID=A0A3F2RH75_9STRA|nr:hypothetical protein BBJ29_005841 [Phytophthora kernoviae]RLN56873.1 hypothetical protein BBP00_00007791 [Phytophthora kernoviae]